MTVYVESNFLLEKALQQEESESCDAILGLAAANAISLVIPAFSLAEPHETLIRNKRERGKAFAELQKQLKKLRRSKPYRDFRDDRMVSILTNSADTEKEGLRLATAALLQTAHVIPLDGEVVALSGQLETEFSMSPQDAIVFASIPGHLRRAAPSVSCFLNRNFKDFDTREVRARLNESGCRYFGNFDHGYQFLRANVSPSLPAESAGT